MVAAINGGKWGDAISLGEKAKAVISENRPSGKTNAKESVYALDSIKEKLFETLVEAYDFKYHLEGLNKDEKAKYILAAREHFRINPAEPMKKHALAVVLIDAGNLTEGLNNAAEVYNSQDKNNDVTDTYAWGLYQAGKKKEAYDIYKNFYAQADTLTQLYHSAVVMEEQDKLRGLNTYKNCVTLGENLRVKEPNIKNLSAQSYISRIISDSKKAIDRLLTGGSGIDSQFRMNTAVTTDTATNTNNLKKR
jgi:hypothetical protein